MSRSRYVIVEATAGVSFAGKLDSLEPHWTVPELEETSAISFAGDGAETLRSIQEITVASQISNLAGYGPTDCPTREKHFWLGDAQDTAEESMWVIHATLSQLSLSRAGTWLVCSEAHRTEILDSHIDAGRLTQT